MADDRFRPMSPAQLPVNSTSDRLFFVPGSEVAYANYDLIRRDFKQTKELTDKQIDEWIIHNFAYVSEGQLKLRGIWTDNYQVDEARSKMAHRPPNYVRSGMIEAEGGGLVDVKGIGYPPGERLDYAIHNTEALRKDLTERKTLFDAAKHNLKILKETSTGTSEELLHIQNYEQHVKEMREYVGYAEKMLTHIDGSMRFGESIAEGHKQESLQHIANLKNREISPTKDIHIPRIETVETYFNIKLPGKVKSALGDSEEETSLYGRQATAGHGRGTDISADIAYNPTPHVGLEPEPKFRGSNAIQVSNSGAVFDYGSLAVTDPDARELHGYDHFTQDAVNRGAFFDLFDSKINNSAYALARDMNTKPESWEEKRRWYQKQRAELIPHLDSTEAPLQGEYASLVELYHRATERKFRDKDAALLIKKIRINNKLDLGSDFIKDTYMMRSNRLQHLTLHSILSGLDSDAAEKLLRADALDSKSLNEFLMRTWGVIQNHTEGMGTIPLPPLYNLWDRMRASKSARTQSVGIGMQQVNFQLALTAQGNEILEKQFLSDLQDTQYAFRQRTLNSLKTLVDRKIDLSRFLSLPKTQEALIQNILLNMEIARHPMLLHSLKVRHELDLAYELLTHPQTARTAETDAFLNKLKYLSAAKEAGLSPSPSCILDVLRGITDGVYSRIPKDSP